ncbi:uncharacterized protein BDCG_05152 [Blastomyces dermatitidis ER-3]|uniref:Knr4/Smi1-like domain-containing protein n=1 Tax=Ajellomyces dermatitidis (strain ER-3 / ATCC MYA-2586) TaxID=559297 RepID=A0ABP2F0A9_AJEDR|nr:uncharacterized protein BDCG_05152 [Blastomyces dermatitidis ER-3]EEQ90032.2 hypothetical protein BDCG_05152 [Blastomyces dermatitidis ER-3]
MLGKRGYISSGIETLLDSFEKVKPNSRDASTGAAAMTASATLVSALDLRWLLKERRYAQEGLISVEELVGIFAKRMEANEQLTYLTQSRRAWEALKDGTLARAIDNNTRTNPDSLRDYMDGPPGSLFHDPASLEEIAATERELGIKLPADYKEFIAITDGFEQSWSGIISDPPLHPLDEIRWLEDDEDYFLDLEIELINPGFPYGMWPTVGKSIEIGCEDIDNVWLIPPSKVQEVQGRLLEIMQSGKYDDALKRRLVGEM